MRFSHTASREKTAAMRRIGAMFASILLAACAAPQAVDVRP
jgi:uncharacterized lipoprotein YajG